MGVDRGLTPCASLPVQAGHRRHPCITAPPPLSPMNPPRHRLAVGGGMNQWDDQMEPYLNFTKALYKDLVTVQVRTPLAIA